MENNNKVWVVYVDEVIDSDKTSYIMGVYKTRELAEQIVKDYADDIKKSTDYNTTEQDDLSFGAYNKGWYADNHYCIFAVEEEVKEN